MATSSDDKIKRRLKGYTFIHKLSAAVSLLMFFIVLASGFSAQASVITIVFRAALAMLAVGLVSRVVIQVLQTYEEMNSG